ncbi:hypothetical protein VN0224_04060 [Helicobacter pylori]|nr:hypothetical protein VN0224_04060 [Helicobacter pylori]
MTRLLTLLYNISNMTITGSVTLSGKNDLKNGSTLDFGSSQVTLTQGTTFNLTSLGVMWLMGIATLMGTSCVLWLIMWMWGCMLGLF